jgi:hypothetical protein
MDVSAKPLIITLENGSRNRASVLQRNRTGSKLRALKFQPTLGPGQLAGAFSF